jgi:uncharacterized protein with FMN-binding domain
MKRFILLTSILCILLLFPSCETPPINKTFNNANAKRGSNQGLVNPVFYNDGTYYGEGNLKNYGKEAAAITISNGQITEVTFKRLDISGNVLLNKNSRDLQTGDTRRQFLKEDIYTNVDLLIADVIKKQSYDISIPTKDKELLLNWKLAVKRALEQAKK